MNAPFKLFGVLVLALALYGCSDKKSYSGSNSGSKSDSKSELSQTPCKFSPMVTKDVAFALGVNLDKQQEFKVVDAYLDQFCGLMQMSDEEIVEVKAKIAKYKKNPFADAPLQLRDFYDETGLYDTKFRWAVFSLENLKISDYGPQLYGLSVAIAGNVNLEKLIQTIQTKSSEESTKGGVAFTEMSLEGEKAWRIEPCTEPGGQNYFLGMDVKVWKEIGVDLHVTSLDGQLTLLASSRGTLAKQIRLYRQGMAKSDALGGFSAKEGELLRLKVVDVGERIRENVSQRALQGIVPMIADVDKVIMSLGDLGGDVKVSPDGTLSTSASLKAASEEDADKLRTLAKVGLMAVRSQWSEDPYIPKDFVKKLDAVKIGGTDGEIKVQNFDLLLAIYPAIASATLSTELNQMSINGRKLVMGMVQANIDRSGKADPVWPRTWKEASDDSDDVSSRAYKSAADYFNVLFDMEHYGTSQWNPVVDGELLSTLGKKAVVRTNKGWRIDPAGLDWCIAANVQDETQDFIPFLISANVNPEWLYADQFNGRDSSLLPIGPKSGASKSMFGDRGIVLVRKSGAAESIKKKFARYDIIYQRQSFDNSGREHPIVWLTPTGVAVPKKNDR